MLSATAVTMPSFYDASSSKSSSSNSSSDSVGGRAKDGEGERVDPVAQQVTERTSCTTSELDNGSSSISSSSPPTTESTEDIQEEQQQQQQRQQAKAGLETNEQTAKENSTDSEAADEAASADMPEDSSSSSSSNNNSYSSNSSESTSDEELASQEQDDSDEDSSNQIEPKSRAVAAAAVADLSDNSDYNSDQQAADSPQPAANATEAELPPNYLSLEKERLWTRSRAPIKGKQRKEAADRRHTFASSAPSLTKSASTSNILAELPEASDLTRNTPPPPNRPPPELNEASSDSFRAKALSCSSAAGYGIRLSDPTESDANSSNDHHHHHQQQQQQQGVGLMQSRELHYYANKKWQLYRVFIQDKVLLFFKNLSADIHSAIDMAIPFDDTSAVITDPRQLADLTMKNAFKVTTKTLTFTFAANESGDRVYWLKAIRESLASTEPCDLAKALRGRTAHNVFFAYQYIVRPTKVGKLQKQAPGKMVGGWKHRTVVLDKELLYYYEQDTEKMFVAKGVFNAKKYRAELDAKDPNKFTCTPRTAQVRKLAAADNRKETPSDKDKSRVFTFWSAEAKDAKDWVKQINELSDPKTTTNTLPLDPKQDDSAAALKPPVAKRTSLLPNSVTAAEPVYVSPPGRPTRAVPRPQSGDQAATAPLSITPAASSSDVGDTPPVHLYSEIGPQTTRQASAPPPPPLSVRPNLAQHLEPAPRSPLSPPSTPTDVRAAIRQAVLGAQVLGKGNFGTVTKATLTADLIPRQFRDSLEDEALEVAVKTLNTSLQTDTHAQAEAKTLRKLRHVNIVQCVEILDEASPTLLVLEFVRYGDLQKLLQHSTTRSIAWNLSEQVSVLGQIATAMQYLVSMKIVHRDLAARNCLVGAELHVKVADFGLAKTEPIYALKSKTLLPVRYLAPECFDHATFDAKTDVWSYGVLIWEVFTYCARLPYEELNTEKAIKAHLDAGKRLELPAGASEKVTALLTKCHNPVPSARASFSKLIAAIEEMVEEDSLTDIRPNLPELILPSQA
ncbi:non-receptor protein kinase [Capsaspora owczarzaki ATCC 30864]|uniref:TKL protein kinase n=1 Tax=Capsaspora owczarzaki (strain ATCC 30864) TaxID=595528 RepID=A0A0D2WXW3_CAPO3|nr:non-receptor protein kinase [Capsaspora owczarzaki ATCC 30864]KJE98160.1 TKL protein kinase [Capsaspora owczarzaki ATCC 30864]|eukprot:XP_004342769.1 non-receptor protein kinase [Capsaspora owczarzaki ATCC 30864]